MHQIFAIALLSIRHAVRSKIFVGLFIMLMVVILVLPFSIRSDGTAAGMIQIMLSYTLGLAGIIMALTSLWAGSSSISSEIEDKTIQMIATKPVTRFQLWLGKWLGLNVMNLFLLTICGASTYAMLQWHLHPDRLQDGHESKIVDGLLSARSVNTPIESELSQRVQEQLDRMISRNELPTGVPEAEATRRIRQQIRMDQNTVRPGGHKTWNFGRPSLPHREIDVTLQFQFSTSVIGQNIVHGYWLIGTPTDPEIITINEDHVSRVLGEISFSLDERWRNNDLLITYSGQNQESFSAVFDPDKIVLLVPQGGFIGNFIRALLIMFGQLAFLAAIGVSAGCLFSLPVASFASCFTLILIQMGSYIERIAGTKIVWPGSPVASESIMSWGSILIALIFKLLALIMYPLMNENALAYISTGKKIELHWIFNTLVLQGFLYSLILGFLASRILNRRELALPTS